MTRPPRARLSDDRPRPGLTPRDDDAPRLGRYQRAPNPPDCTGAPMTDDARTRPRCWHGKPRARLQGGVCQRTVERAAWTARAPAHVFAENMCFRPGKWA